MLVTKQTELQGQFKAYDSLRLFWNSVNLNPLEYYFVVEGSGLVDGCFGPSVRLVSGVEQVDSICKGDAPEFLSVNRIQLIAPPSMTNLEEFSMQMISEIRIKEGSESNPIYEFVTRGGQVYSSARG
ncbi:hypothetical protein D3C81_1653270 [compost metagenome]|uniref:hypothetical protein n=1 Tax=Pseudomonas vranovensis TaxID=321661 RepID=UPI000F968B17